MGILCVPNAAPVAFAIISGMQNPMTRILRFLLRVVLIIVIGIAIILCAPNAIEVIGQQGNIQSQTALKNSSTTYDCILVLGASVNSDGTPSSMLKDRLDMAVKLYKAGVSSKIIMSGDDESDSSYDEVSTMKSYAVSKGVPSSDIFCDHAGICTYDSMYRAANVFQAKSMVVVTQQYHLTRALFDANSLGIKTVGVSSSLHTYDNQDHYDQREFFARISDFGKVITKAQSAYLSEPVSLDQSGDVTSW